jgi:hypothetical protein
MEAEHLLGQLMADSRFMNGFNTILACLDVEKFAETYFVNLDTAEPFRWVEWQRKIVRAFVKGDVSQFIILSGRGAGKSSLIRYIVAALLIMRPGIKIGVFSLGRKAAEDNIMGIKDIIANSIFSTFLSKRPAKSGFQLDNGIAYKNIRSPGSLVAGFAVSEYCRGTSFNLIVLDECSRLEEDFITGAVIPTLRLNFKYRKMLIASTPDGMRGYFYNQWVSETNDNIFWKEHVQDEIYFDDAGRIDAERSRFVVPWMNAEFAQQRLDEMGERMFRQEYMGEFLSDQMAVFKRDLIIKMWDYSGGEYVPVIDPEISIEEMEEIALRYGQPKAPDPRSYGGLVRRFDDGTEEIITVDMQKPVGYPFIDPSKYPVIIAGDFAKHLDYTVLMVLTKRPTIVDVFNGKRKMREVVSVVWCESIKNENYETNIKPKILTLIDRFQPTELVFDGNSQGDSFLDNLEVATTEYCNRRGLPTPTFYNTAMKDGNVRLGLIVGNDKPKERIINELNMRLQTFSLKIPFHDNCMIHGSVYNEFRKIGHQMTTYRMEKREGLMGIRLIYGDHSMKDDHLITLAMGCYALRGIGFYPYHDDGAAITFQKESIPDKQDEDRIERELDKFEVSSDGESYEGGFYGSEADDDDFYFTKLI